MSKQTRLINPIYNLLPMEFEGFDSLAELALDMRWSWNHAADEVWRQLDPVLWELTHHPWDVLQTVSREKVQHVLADPAFRKNVDDLVQARRDAAEAPAWFQQIYSKSHLNCVAYFSMEFMLSEALPIYSGGLGNVAGDQLKAASDLGVPVVGVGLLYQQGYFRQVLDKDGAQQALFPYNDPGQLPITPLRQANGEWLRLKLDFPGYPVWLRAWQVQVGRVQLYLLDSNDLANLPAHRGITSRSFVEYARERLSRQLAASGATPEAVDGAKHLFDPNALTLGFARRFATYKRPNLLLHDPERLLRLLTNPQRPVQLILAGKAHPADPSGQALIKEWMQFIQRPEARLHVIFFSDYNMLLSEYLVQGIDVWINTPRRPWEACGTSGMKVLVNGGINLSELDGWWAEAYTPEVGWALGDGQEHGDDPAWDAVEADALYDLLEREVIPEFYTRDKKGIPTAWVARMRESMARLTPQFSANRTVREYTEQHYLPAASAYRERAADRGAMGVQLVNWQRAMEQHWSNLRFGEMKVMTDGEKHVFEVQVYLSGLDPNTVRVIPHCDGVAIPLEAAQILWQR